MQLPEWYDGEYIAEAELTANGQSLRGRATPTKPPTPWLPAQREWRATRVLPPWTPLTRRDGPHGGHVIQYWRGEVTLAGPLPLRYLRTSK